MSITWEMSKQVKQMAFKRGHISLVLNAGPGGCSFVHMG